MEVRAADVAGTLYNAATEGSTQMEIALAIDEYRPIEGFPRHQVSRCGRVIARRARKPMSRRAISEGLWNQWKELKPWSHKSGHLYVSLDGHNRQVHRLVLSVFSGVCPAGLDCRHIDGNATNNRASNLAWGTRAENEADKKLHGTGNEGAKHYAAKLCDFDALAARELRRRHPGRSGVVRFVSRWFGISQAQASNVCNGVCYARTS
jgi:hypothetical protein